MDLFKQKSLLAVLFLALGSSLAHAAEGEGLANLSLEDLLQQEVVLASKLAQQVSDSPSAVVIVTAADIRAYGYRTLADVINSMRGLYTTYDYRYQYMGGRAHGAPGDYAGRVMLLIDGYATQDSLFSQAYLDESGLLDLEMVERVEYVPGTGSVTYGNNAMLGIINVVTRKGGDFNATQLSEELSSHGGRKERLSFGKRFESGLDLLLSASALDVDGANRLYFPAYDTPATNNGIAEKQDGDRNWRLFGKLAYAGWTVEGAYVDRRKMVPNNPNSYTAFNRPFSMRDENGFVNARYETDLGLMLHSSSRIYHGYYGYEGAREFADDSDGEKFGRRSFEGKWWGVDQKFVGNWFRDHAIIFGVEWRHDYRQSFQWNYLSAAGASVRQLKENYSRHTTSVYLADEYRLNDQWSINLGARYDDASDQPGNWSPRLAVIYRPSLQTTVKASYSEAFKLPNGNDRSNYGVAAAPEFVAANELVLQHQLSPGMRLTGSLYQYHLTGQLVYDALVDDYVPTGSSKTQGLEVELESSWDSGVRLRSSAAWQHARDADGLPLVNSPHVLGKFNLTFPLPGQHLRAGYEAQYLGSRQTLERRQLSGVALSHLTLSSEGKWHGLSGALSIRNLFDRRYEVASPFDWRPDSGYSQDSLRMDGRTLWFQLNYDL
ncbi:MAG: TonB-dependent receptor [Azonexus sp.]